MNTDEDGLEAIRKPAIIPSEVAWRAIKTAARMLDERMSELALAYLMGSDLTRLGRDYKPEKAELSHAAVCRWLIEASSEPPAKEETR